MLREDLRPSNLSSDSFELSYSTHLLQKYGILYYAKLRSPANGLTFNFGELHFKQPHIGMDQPNLGNTFWQNVLGIFPSTWDPVFAPQHDEE